MRGRAGQAVAAHHTRLQISTVHEHVRRRVRKSAILRVKRLGDEGRRSKHVVKVESSTFDWAQNLTTPEIEAGDSSDRDDALNDGHATAGAVPPTRSQEDDGEMPLVQIEESQVVTAGGAVSTTQQKTGQKTKKAALQVNKNLNKARKKSEKK